MMKEFVFGVNHRVIVVEKSEDEYCIIIEQNGSEMECVEFNMQRWSNFVDLKYFFDYKLMNTLTCRYHVGKNVYASITSNKIGLHQYFGSDVKEVTLGIEEWSELKKVFDEIYRHFPELSNISPCDHANQESTFFCGECSDRFAYFIF